MKKILALILTAAMLLTLTACDGAGNSSDTSGSSVESGQSSEETSKNTNELSAMPEWEYATLVRDNYKKYYIASSSPENGLPNVPNNLVIRSLKTAIEEDSTGKMKSLVEKFCTEPSLSERIKMTDEILHLLCETDKITESNEFFSMKKLAILEGFWGTGDEFPELTSEVTAPLLEDAYKYLTERYCMAMIGSQCLPYIDLISSKLGDDKKYHPVMENYNKQIFEDWASGKLTEKQLSDNALYLAYYGVIRDKNLTMSEEFCAYAKEHNPETLTAIVNGTNEAAELFSGINDVVIPKLTVETPNGENSDASGIGSQS